MGGRQAGAKSKRKKSNGKKKDDFAMLIDEFGDLGTEKTSSGAFGFGISITDKTGDMEEIVKWHRPLKKEELKFSGSKDVVKHRVVKEISGLRPETYATYVDKRKNDPPDGWLNADRSAAYRSVLRESVKHALEETEKDDFIVLIDHHDALGREGRAAIDGAVEDAAGESDSKKKNVVSYEEVDSKSCDAMQAHDFVAGAAYAKLTYNGSWSDRLGMKFRRLRK
jgi:hypothetical protein